MTGIFAILSAVWTLNAVAGTLIRKPWNGRQWARQEYVKWDQTGDNLSHRHNLLHGISLDSLSSLSHLKLLLLV